MGVFSSIILQTSPKKTKNYRNYRKPLENPIPKIKSPTKPQAPNQQFYLNRPHLPSGGSRIFLRGTDWVGHLCTLVPLLIFSSQPTPIGGLQPNHPLDPPLHLPRGKAPNLGTLAGNCAKGQGWRQEGPRQTRRSRIWCPFLNSAQKSDLQTIFCEF